MGNKIIMWHDIPQSIYSIALLGLCIRLLFVFFGSRIIDGSALFGGLQYTDIDYYVYCDSADNILQGKSPYDQSTYRYPPIFAILMTFNRLLHFPEFGKVLFSIADVMVGVEIYSLLELKAFEMNSISFSNEDFHSYYKNENDKSIILAKYSRFWSWVWMINPISIMISTRGSSDSISNFVVLLLLRQTKNERYSTAGALLGLAIHLRIYPIIFLPSLLFHILFSCSSNRNPHYQGRDSNKAPPENRKSLFSYYYSFFSLRNSLQCVYFLLSTICSLSLATAISYYFYGPEYMQQSIFYHLYREDHRHNFSVHFYWIYLRKMQEAILPPSSSTTISSYSSSNSSSWPCSANNTTDASSVVNLLCQLSSYSAVWRIGLFLPQILLFASIILTYSSKNLEACFLLQTMVFVTYNKVVTAQYFIWYLCLLPVAIGEGFDDSSDTAREGAVEDEEEKTSEGVIESSSHLSSRNRSIWNMSWKVHVLLASLLVWVCTLSMWLYHAYQLEFMGRNLFFKLWQCSVLFHFANALCIGIIIFAARC